MMGLSLQAQKASKIEVKVPSLNCVECEQIIIDRLYKRVDGIVAVDVKWKRKSVKLSYLPDRIDPGNIRLQIAEIGFDADEEKADDKDMMKLPACCRRVALPVAPPKPSMPLPALPQKAVIIPTNNNTKPTPTKQGSTVPVSNIIAKPQTKTTIKKRM